MKCQEAGPVSLLDADGRAPVFRTAKHHWIVNENSEARTISLKELLTDLEEAGYEIYAVLPDRTVIARRPLPQAIQ